MRRISRWEHPNFPNKYFEGKYDKTDKSKTRIFVLSCFNWQSNNDPLIEQVVFDSHEKAKAAKWVKVK